ncbi:hypothetical protein K3495_g820 [Podosphaera aphanis]|nr:hypothetical protein K3495_g820 [Podosphaera aphanis]
MRLRQAARIILIGAPGVGKGTQALRLLDRFPQLSSLSSGNLLRDHVHNQTPLGIEVSSAMASGKLVPDSIILNLIIHELQSRKWIQPASIASNQSLSSSSHTTLNNSSTASQNLTSHLTPFETSNDPLASFILDGFPRTIDQAQKLDDLIPINFVVWIKTPVSKILERIAGRWIHAPSGRVYNTTFNKPKVEGLDDITGEKLTKRQDDKLETWKKRLDQFEEANRPLLNHYSQKNLLWEVEGQSSDEITPKLFEEVRRRFGADDE